jgi:diguanylate cyclase (GGDEF)-like protein
MVCRFGGEEFVIAFPGLPVDAAARALGRVQEQLVLALSAGTVPPFTASFGVADGDDVSSLEDLCRSADMALFRAKKEGRNRVAIGVHGAELHQPAQVTGAVGPDVSRV